MDVHKLTPLPCILAFANTVGRVTKKRNTPSGFGADLTRSAALFACGIKISCHTYRQRDKCHDLYVQVRVAEGLITALHSIWLFRGKSKK